MAIGVGPDDLERSLEPGSAGAAVGSRVRTLIALLAVVPGLLLFGWHEPVISVLLERALTGGLLGLYLVTLGLEAWRLEGGSAGRRQAFLRVTRPEQLAAVLGAGLVWWGAAASVAAVVLLVLHVVRLYLRLVQTKIPPGLVFIGSFLVLIAVGTAVLKLPAATPRGDPISWLDAAFTITSAISQTGLVVRPTGEGFTRFGHVVILVWIQVGALGVILFGALLANLLGSGFGLRATQTIAEGTEQGWAGQLSMQRLVTFIVIVTHAVELVGAVVFYVSWPEAWEGMPADMETRGDRFFHAVFFSVSSFCGAGFVTTANSMEGLRGHWTPHLVLAPLVILGSIGFPVLDNLWRVFWSKVRGIRTRGGSLVRLSLNTKLVLATTLALYVVGFVLILVGEATQTDEPLRLVVLDAHFMTVSRTSGFDTIPPERMGLLSQLVLIFLMFAGGSPFSVAGGVKVMVVAVLALTAWATVRGRPETTAFGRTLPDALVRKCATLIVLCLAVVLTTTGVLAVTEEGVALDVLLFEATSAFGTVGLSMGITPELSPVGRVAVIVAMFVGRVGIFAFLAALLTVARRKRASYHYPSEDVVVY